jgi:HK97 family phage major capsid protein
VTTATAKPTTPAEWEEYLNTALADPAAFGRALKDGSFRENLKAYQTAQNSTMRDVSDQVNEQVQLAMAEFAEKNGGRPAGQFRPGQKGSAYNKHAPGAGLDGKFESAADFFSNALSNPNNMTRARREKFEEIRNYSSQTGEGGGFLIPEEFRAEIFGGPALESAIVRPNATVVPMASETLKYPAVDFSTEVGEIWGGMVFYWMDEQGTIPDTSAAFAQIEFHARRLAGAAKVPNDTIKDSAALNAWLRSALPRGIREFEDRAFLKGDGVKKPLGALIQANPSLIVAGDEGAAQQSGITWLNVLAMASRLLPESWDRAVWVITPDAFAEVWSMALPVGTGGSAVMIAPGAGTDAPQMTLLGRPIKWSRKAPAALGTQGDISLADFSLYGVADRQDVRLETSEHAFFLQDQTAFKVIERVDGQPLLLSPLTPENNGPTLSGFVQLATRTVT